jgi:hypothetical protein
MDRVPDICFISPSMAHISDDLPLPTDPIIIVNAPKKKDNNDTKY